MTRAILSPLTIILALMCIQWLSLGSIGGFSLTFPYLTLALGTLYAASSQRRLAACAGLVRDNAIWLFPFAIYLVLLAAVLLGSLGQNSPVRQGFYLISGIAFAGSLAVARDPHHILRVGAGASLIIFIVVVEVLARSRGMSWVDAITQFAVGDRQYVTYQFFREVLNALGSDTDEPISAAQKNGIAVSVLTAAFVFKAASGRKTGDFIGTAGFCLALAILLLLDTRSVLIVAGAGILLATLLRGALYPAKLHSTLVTLAVVIGAMTIWTGYASWEGAAADSASDRFAFDDDSTFERESQYAEALDVIAEHPLTGAGYLTVGGIPVHNLFLSAWAQTGLAGFLLVLLFFCGLVARWLAVIFSTVRQPTSWVMPMAFEWIAPLPLMPIARVWISGDNGHPFLGEWLALSIFLGVVLGNELRLRSMMANRMPPGARTPSASVPARQWAPR